MAYAEITPQVTDYGTERIALEEYLEGYNALRLRLDVDPVDTIDQVWIDDARAEVLRDLAGALNLNPSDASDMAMLEELIVPHVAAIAHAISLQQRIMYYADTQQGAETANARLMEMRLAEYRQVRRGFARMRERRTTFTTRTTTVRVMR